MNPRNEGLLPLPTANQEVLSRVFRLLLSNSKASVGYGGITTHLQRRDLKDLL
jgi:hypothetical protein